MATWLVRSLAICGPIPKHRLKNGCLSHTVLSMVPSWSSSNFHIGLGLTASICQGFLGHSVHSYPNVCAPLRRLQNILGKHPIIHGAVESSNDMDRWHSPLMDAFRSLPSSLHIPSPELTPTSLETDTRTKHSHSSHHDRVHTMMHTSARMNSHSNPECRTCFLPSVP